MTLRPLSCLAVLAGVLLSAGPVSAQAADGPTQTPGPMPVRAMAMREAVADTPVAAGQMEFHARVTVTATLT